VVDFSEPVTKTSAEDISHFDISPTAVMATAKLAADGKSIVLETTEPLDPGIERWLTVTGVADRATARNLIAAGSRTRIVPEGDGLAAVYYDNMDMTGGTVERVDPRIDFDWGERAPDPAIGPDTFSVRWTGKVRADFSEIHTFHALTDDGVRLWVDDKLIVDEWRDMRPSEHSGTVFLEAGRLYPIRMEHYDNTLTAIAKLQWSSPSVPKSVIPQRNLYSGRR
jgi:hypothetical protein